jgi:hypothetical protein
MDFKTCTERELWEYVAVSLSKKGIKTVLVGGAVAAIYSEGAYRSGDLDMIIESYNMAKSKVNDSMEAIGFTKLGRYWIHPECTHLYVEFVNPPIAIGDDYSVKPVEWKKGGELIKILSAEDCVRDRLTSYAYFKARECLDQAYLVAKKNKIDLTKMNKWAKNEGKEMVNAIKELEEKLEANNRCS